LTINSEEEPLAVRLRRISQIAFFILFVCLLARTKLLHSSGDETQLSYPVNLFFKLDPLTALINAIAGRAFYYRLLWSFLILIPTLFLGRFFCGWICPMGSLNHILSRIGSEPKRGKRMIATNRYKNWQMTKYVLLIAGMLAALCRSNIVSWVDPFSWLVRSMGLSVLPTAASKKYFVVTSRIME
jgi:polyferredoxin